ncbi:MAG TPA: hypothetical protein PKN50_04015 [Spirochaetota bacterium]|nr:hypothetical protein [Spirochaetota bacterium]HPV40960.1 hypothetical protein [Spirochaetota bacterium]
MKPIKVVSTLLVCVLGITIMMGCSSTYTGKIAVKGNEPFTYLALVTDNGDMKITGPLEKKLREHFQGRRVTVKGTIVKEGKGFLSLRELEVTEIVNSGE